MSACCDSPFKIIGPPREIDGLPAIYPMQVMGPDREIVYLTQIRSDLPLYDLPRAATFIDKLFILVLACSDLDASLAWFERETRLSLGRKWTSSIRCSPNHSDCRQADLHTIATLMHGRDVFLELDQYPRAATSAPCARQASCRLVSVSRRLMHPEFELLEGTLDTSRRRERDGVIYQGRRAGTKRAPDGSLLEIVASD